MNPPNEKESFAALFEGSDTAKRGVRRFSRGERLDVTVVAIGQTSVFVDLGGKVEGFIERVELAEPNGTLRLAVGDHLSVMVVESDGERVRLSPAFVRAKQEVSIDAQGNPILSPAKQGPLLLEGAIVRGVVTGVERYGVFVQIDGTRGRSGRGLVPAAETGSPRGADLRKTFPDGSPVEAKIVAIAEDGKIRLSIKAAKDDAERREFEAFSEKRADAPGDEKPKDGAVLPPAKKGQAPSPRNFGTLGDLLSKRKKP
ncbi:MAG: S1 RNA-binding domain-containing protein [Polyangiaceae bacterium]